MPACKLSKFCLVDSSDCGLETVNIELMKYINCKYKDRHVIELQLKQTNKKLNLNYNLFLNFNSFNSTKLKPKK